MGTIQDREVNLEYTDAPPSELTPNDTQMPQVRPATPGAPSEGAEGKASDLVALLLSIIPGLGHIYKGHKLAGFLWMAGAVPVGIFVLLAAIASAGFGIGLFFFYLIAVMLHAYAIEDWVTPKIQDEGEQY
jgi:TM2 domain-containing membrane protein YozV